MEIVKTVKIKLTEEEKDILKQAQEILVEFESCCSDTDEEDLQDMYEEHVDYYEHDKALPTAIDLLDTILENTEDTEEEE